MNDNTTATSETTNQLLDDIVEVLSERQRWTPKRILLQELATRLGFEVDERAVRASIADSEGKILSTSKGYLMTRHASRGTGSRMLCCL